MYFAPGISLKPMTLISPGISSPSSYAALYIPVATESFEANIAVGRLPSSYNYLKMFLPDLAILWHIVINF